MTLISQTGNYTFFDIKKFSEQTINRIEIQKQTALAFIKFTPLVMNDILDAVEKSNSDKMKKMVHKLRASASILCTESLQLEINTLEKEAQYTGEATYDTRIHELLKNILQLIDEVKSFNDTLS